jgi:hypothetical protein
MDYFTHLPPDNDDDDDDEKNNNEHPAPAIPRGSGRSIDTSLLLFYYSTINIVVTFVVNQKTRSCSSSCSRPSAGGVRYRRVVMDDDTKCRITS